MRMEEYRTLKNILLEFRQEVETIEKQIQEDLEYIREKEVSLKALTGDEPEDFKVFSPRKPETLHKAEIERLRKEKSVYEGKNRELENRKSIFEKYIPIFEDIVKCTPEESKEERISAQELHDSVMCDLEKLVQKIESSSTHIVMNPIQAKQDFAVIGSCLKNTIDKMKNTVWIV